MAETEPFPNAGTEDDQLCAEVGPGVWLMDDHRWAFYVWAQHALGHPDRLPLRLVHVDAHADAVDGFYPDPASWAPLQHETSLARIYERVAQDTDITLASFIAPAVRRGWVTEVRFYGCAADDDLLDAPLLAASGASQWRHETVAELLRAVDEGPLDRPLLLDIDLDVFNAAAMPGESCLWPRADIVACLDACAPLIRRADVVTIARSFRFSGAASDTVWLTGLVVPLVLDQRKAG